MTLDVHIRAKTYPSRTPGEDHVAVADLGFSVPEGQFTCIVGPSGCGKTTLLNIVSGLEQEVDGTVSLSGRPTDQAHLGYMFQTPRLMPWLSVMENVRLVMDGTTRHDPAEGWAVREVLFPARLAVIGLDHAGAHVQVWSQPLPGGGGHGVGEIKEDPFGLRVTGHQCAP